jgi:hypothetical protein
LFSPSPSAAFEDPPDPIRAMRLVRVISWDDSIDSTLSKATNDIGEDGLGPEKVHYLRAPFQRQTMSPSSSAAFRDPPNFNILVTIIFPADDLE